METMVALLVSLARGVVWGEVDGQATDAEDADELVLCVVANVEFPELR